MTQDRVPLGKVGRARGLHGAVVFWPFNRDTDALVEDMKVFVGDRTLTIESLRDLNDGIEMIFVEITTPEEARTLTNAELSIDRKDLPALEDDEYYLSELVGLEVRDPNGTVLGKVRGLVDAGPQTLIEVLPHSGAVVLVPATEHFIITVVRGSHVVLNAPEGMFE